MKGLSLACALSAVLAGVSFGGPVQAQERFVTIGTGGQTGVYYVAGQSICRFLNRGAADHQIKCNAPASGGGVANVNGIRSGEFNFGIMQSDHQYKAMKGCRRSRPRGHGRHARRLLPAERGVHHPGPQGRQDRRLRRSQGQAGQHRQPGSGQRDTFEEIMAVKGWKKGDFGLVSELKPAEQASALGDNNIDAMSYFVGHPNGAIQEASTTTDAVLVPVTGADIDKLLAEKSYYSKAEIPVASTRAATSRPRPSAARRYSPPVPRPIRKWSISWSSRCSTTWIVSSACTRPSPT